MANFLLAAIIRITQLKIENNKPLKYIRELVFVNEIKAVKRCYPSIQKIYAKFDGWGIPSQPSKQKMKTIYGRLCLHLDIRFWQG